MNYLDSLLETDGFKAHQEKTATNLEDLPSVVVHFTPIAIMKTTK